MNARGETLGRLSLAVLATLPARELVEEPSDTYLVAMIFVFGVLFGLGPTISQWIEEKNDEGGDDPRPRQSDV